MVIVLALAACTGPAADTDSASPRQTSFEPGFLWGTAVAGFQVEAGCPTIDAATCEDRASDWYQWVTDPELVAESGNYLSGDPLANAPGHYELYADDLALATALGTNAFRTSIEWSRLFPDGAAEAATTVEELRTYADPTALAYYHAYFDAIAAAGLRPLVTLDHYTLPLWLHDGKACHADLATCTDRGWMDLDRLKPAIALYSAFCADEFGDRVDDWATLNEPLAIVLSGYLLPSPDRTNPPAVKDPDAAFAVFFNLIEGHAAMYDAVKAYDTADADGDGVTSSVGLVDNLVAVRPLDEGDDADLQGAADADYVYNRLFLEGAINGDLDRDLDGIAEEHRDDLAGRMDFLGINYYTRLTVQGLAGPLYAGYAKMDFFPTTFWEEYPDGLYDVVAEASAYGLPMIITENGTQPTDDSGDTFLRPHLDALLRAKADGYDVGGYFYWSLLDNYEWNHGMGMRFGMYAVDPATKARTLRPIGETYADVIATGVP
jgi:beta-glucosidase/6-phospho-beta-glucosidase/beta-galactosidase